MTHRAGSSCGSYVLGLQSIQKLWTFYPYLIFFKFWSRIVHFLNTFLKNRILWITNFKFEGFALVEADISKWREKKQRNGHSASSPTRQISRRARFLYINIAPELRPPPRARGRGSYCPDNHNLQKRMKTTPASSGRKYISFSFHFFLNVFGIAITVI